MKGFGAIFIMVIILLLGLQGCQARSTPEPTAQAELEGPAAVPVVRSVEVLQSDVPQQVLVLVQAVLPNTCLRLGEAAIERSGQEFTIRLLSEKASGQVCQTAAISQDKIIRLPADTLAPGSYIVLVNGVLGSFRVTASAQAALPAAAPASASQPAAVLAAALDPTPTPALEPTQEPSPTPTEAPLPVEAPILVPTPTAAPLALAVGDDPARCVNKAAFYGTLTIPDGTPFQPGAKFQKTWLVMNAGSCTWGSDYHLVFAGGDPIGAQQKIPLPKASPRQVVQISVTMTAPVAPQTYESLWAFESPDGYLFGLGNPAVTPLLAKINVVPLPVGLPSGLDCGALRVRNMEEQVLEQINSTRAQYGLPPLALVEEISQVALKHSLEMACYNRDLHAGRDGMLYNVRLQRDGILFDTSNEILYAGNGGPAGSILWWMNSSIHKPIVLSTRYTQVGIGFVYYEKNPYKHRITVNFINP